jgi:predicted nucleic acid-binding protein
MTPAFVVDSSLAMAWCFADEATPETQALLLRMETEAAAVPSWWFLEITNVLYLTEKKKRITSVQVAEFIALLEGFDLSIQDDGPSRAFSTLLPLCRSHELTSYDALYLDLAMSRQLPLATLDEALRKAAIKAGVPLLGK